MIFKRALAIFCILLLAGCAKNLVKTPLVIETHAANTKLAESASTTTHALTALNHFEIATHPSLINRPLVNPNDFAMSTLASIDWSGPVGPITAKIAMASGYRLRVLGSAPAIPVLVFIHKKEVPLGDILRNIDYQCVNRAAIKIFPSMRIIELRYASH